MTCDVGSEAGPVGASYFKAVTGRPVVGAEAFTHLPTSVCCVEGHCLVEYTAPLDIACPF